MEDRHFNISITSGTVIKVVVVLVVAWLIFTLRNIVLDVVTAIVLASSIEPAVLALCKRRFPRVLAVLTVYVLLFGAFFVLFYFFLPSVLEDIATFVASIPAYLDFFTRVGAFDTYANILGVPAPSLVNAGDIMT
ncbi:MAG: AI-2E family transporter, partial [Patescibacteria group bacterium]|nr:AI-2E family transporter [Patescibacteria group bacterium]